MSHAHAPLGRPETPDDASDISVRSERILSEMSIDPGSPICLDKQDGPQAFLVESGIVAVFAVIGRTPPACVALAGSGILLEPEAKAVLRYRAVGPVTGILVPTTLVEQEIQRQATLRSLYLAQLRERRVEAELLAACNARHSLTQRCSRLLLGLHGHFGESIPITHSSLASLLGVRRAGVSMTLERLQQNSAIQQRRGKINLINPPGLADYACNCRTECIQSAHPIPAQLLQSDPEISGGGWRVSAFDMVKLMAQSHRAIQVSRRLLDENWKRRLDFADF